MIRAALSAVLATAATLRPARPSQAELDAQYDDEHEDQWAAVRETEPEPEAPSYDVLDLAEPGHAGLHFPQADMEFARVDELLASLRRDQFLASVRAGRAVAA